MFRTHIISAKCDKIKILEPQKPDFCKEILMTNRVHLTLNLRIWKAKNPYEIHEASWHDQEVTGVYAKTIVGPFFFREDETADGNRYR